MGPNFLHSVQAIKHGCWRFIEISDIPEVQSWLIFAGSWNALNISSRQSQIYSVPRAKNCRCPKLRDQGPSMSMVILAMWFQWMVSPGRIRREINFIFTTLLTRVRYITLQYALRPERLNRQLKLCCRDGFNGRGLQSSWSWMPQLNSTLRNLDSFCRDLESRAKHAQQKVTGKIPE